VLRVINRNPQSSTLTATAYDEAGSIVGVANTSLGTLASRQMLAFTSAQLEAAIGFAPASGVAKYRVEFKADLPSFDLINFVKDIATGNISLGQAQIDGPVAATASTSTRNALFVSASTSGNKTTVLRAINIGNQSGTLTAKAYDEAGNPVGVANASLGAISARQMLAFTSAQLEAAIGYVPVAPTAKYRIVIDSNLPSFELINFIKDIASGNLTLGQNQVDNRPPSSATSSSRSALSVNASSGSKISVVRLINLSNQSATVTATAYDDAGNLIGTDNANVGSLSAQRALSFTSAQLESLIGYSPSSSETKYRITFSAALPSFELINFTKDVASGNLTLAQAQVDNIAAGTASSSSRNVLFVNAASSTNKTSVMRLTNPNRQSGTLTVTAYNEAGSIIGTQNASIGTIGAQQTMTLSSAQIETAIGYTPSGTAKYSVVFNANLPNFELINYVKDVATGAIVPAQEQLD